MLSRRKGKGKSSKSRKGSNKEPLDATSQQKEPRQNPTTVQSPPSKEKKILGYFPRSPEPASAGSKADPTAALKASQEQAHDLTRGEVSSQRTENEPKESGEKQRGESKWEPAGEGGPVVGSDKEHPEKDQRKVDTGSKEKKGSKKTRIRSRKKPDTSKQPEITQHFPVRRSSRRCKSVIEEEKRKNMEEAILEGREEGLEVREVPGKGRGVFATRAFAREEFVCEYAGELVDRKTAQEREAFYGGKADVGCYMYYFNFNGMKYCVDATKETGRLGRLLNHSKSGGNCGTRVVSIGATPHLILQTKRDVHEGEELLYDYGERNKEIIASHPWLET